MATLHEFWGAIGSVSSNGSDRLALELPGIGFVMCLKRLTKLRPPGPRPDQRFIKYVGFEIHKGNRRAMQVESRAVDAIPYDLSADAFYLIRRSDSGLLALPGGFIDPEDGINTLPLKETLLNAAFRELTEETGAAGFELKPLGPSVREQILPGRPQVKREHITRTWPFAALMTMQALHPADDAQQAPGSPGLLPGWYRSTDDIESHLHFAHHATILRRLRFEAGNGFRKTKVSKRLLPFRGMDLAAARKLGEAVGQCTRRDYDRIVKGKEPILPEDGDFVGVDWLGLTGRVK